MLVLQGRPFARGLTKVKLSSQDWKHIMTNWKFTDLDVEDKVAWLTDYKQLKSRHANERQLMLEILRDKAKEKGGLDVLSQ